MGGGDNVNLKGTINNSTSLSGSAAQKNAIRGLLGTNPQAVPVTVDNALSLSSTNPVQNKVITQAITGRLLSDDVKAALLQLAQKVTYSDDDGQDYCDDLYDALYPPVGLDSIGAVFDSSATIYDTDTLDDLKQYLAVTAFYSDGTSEDVTTYTLSGSMDVGTQTITVAYGGKTTTFTVTVVEWLVSIDAVFTQGSATIYDTDSLDTLEQYLVVTATYADGTTATVSDYVLSGTLAVGTSTITVSYGGKTDTFSVTVTKFWTFEWDYSMGKLESQTDWNSEVGGTASSSLVTSGERFISNESGTNYIQVFPIAGNPLKTMADGKGTVQITFVGNIGTGNVHNFRMSTAKDATQRMQILIAQGKFRVFSNSTPSSCQAIADYANGVEYTVKMVLRQTVADIYINGVLVGDGIQASIVVGGQSNYLMAQNLGSGHYIDLKSYKIRLGEA